MLTVSMAIHKYHFFEAWAWGLSLTDEKEGNGGRRLARQRASSDPTPMNHSNKDGIASAESEEGRGAVDNAANLARCKSLRRQLPVYGRLVDPVRAEATKHVLPGCQSLGRPTAKP